MTVSDPGASHRTTPTRRLLRAVGLVAALVCLGGLVSPGLAAHVEVAAGPGILFDGTGVAGALGLHLGAGLHRPLTATGDVGVVLAGEYFARTGGSIRVLSLLQFRQRLGRRLGLLLGAGGAADNTSRQSLKGYVYPTAGISYELARTTLEFRFTPNGSPRSGLVRYGSLTVAWRRAL